MSVVQLKMSEYIHIFYIRKAAAFFGSV